jgi:hypothetical protein
MMKSYTYGAQGIMDFMGIAKPVHQPYIYRLQDSGKSAQPQKNFYFLNSSHFRVKYIPTYRQLDGAMVVLILLKELARICFCERV